MRIKRTAISKLRRRRLSSQASYYRRKYIQPIQRDFPEFRSGGTFHSVVELPKTKYGKYSVTGLKKVKSFFKSVRKYERIYLKRRDSIPFIRSQSVISALKPRFVPRKNMKFPAQYVKFSKINWQKMRAAGINIYKSEIDEQFYIENKEKILELNKLRKKSQIPGKGLTGLEWAQKSLFQEQISEKWQTYNTADLTKLRNLIARGKK